MVPVSWLPLRSLCVMDGCAGERGNIEKDMQKPIGGNGGKLWESVVVSVVGVGV